VAPELVVVGASWGGLEAVARLLDHLPPSFTCPMVLVQHRAPQPSQLAPLLQRHTKWCVCEVDDKDVIRPATLYLAPPGYHLLVGRGHFELSIDAPVRWSRPSIDVTFESAADAYREGLVGVVLTGANADGAEGLARIAHRGGMPVVQDPATAVEPTMPRAALAAVPDAEVLTIEGIADRLQHLCEDASA
jgi:two-component system, chemotaxis family, protein-glutamate methylesterase/glutaminase